MSEKNLLVYLRADVVLVGERMILNCKEEEHHPPHTSNANLD